MLHCATIRTKHAIFCSKQFPALVVLWSFCCSWLFINYNIDSGDKHQRSKNYRLLHGQSEACQLFMDFWVSKLRLSRSKHLLLMYENEVKLESAGKSVGIASSSSQREAFSRLLYCLWNGHENFMPCLLLLTFISSVCWESLHFSSTTKCCRLALGFEHLILHCLRKQSISC